MKVGEAFPGQYLKAVDLRGKPATVRVVKYPFVRNGKSCL